MSMSMLLNKLKDSRKTRVVLAAIALIPLIYAGLLTWANQDPTHNLDNIPAAVVNLDQGTSVDGERVDLGATITDELTGSTATNNFAWEQLDASEAHRRLASGEALAVLTIPADFSVAAASPAGNDAATAQTATLELETNDGANLIAGTIASTIASTVRDNVATEISAKYLENIYLGFTSVHDSVADASEGAAELAAGATNASAGSATLVSGLNDLADGTSTLSSGAGALLDGTNAAASGARQLATGLDNLQSQASALPSQSQQLAKGATAASTGATSLSSGVEQLALGAHSLAEGATTALTGAQRLDFELGTLADQTPALSAGAGSVSAGLQALLANYDSLTDAQRKALLSELVPGAETVATGTAAVDSAAQSLSAGAAALVGSATDSTGLTALAAGAAALRSGADDAATGAEALQTGTAQLAAGAAALATRAPQLTEAITAAATAAETLAGGTASVADGSSSLADGAAALQAGAASAATGAGDLHAGLGDLTAGADKLSDGLKDGMNSIPTFTDTEAAQLSSVTADPVATTVSRMNEVPEYGYGLAPYFLALALWVGALGFYLMMPALTPRALRGRGTPFLVAVRSFAPGAAVAAIQGALAASILIAGIGITPANGWGLLGMIMLTSLTFFAINQALIALLGAPGRFLALILIVLQLAAAGGTYPIQTAPAFFQAIHPWMPLTYSVEAFRSLIAGGNIGVGQAVWVLIAWLVGAFVLTVVASFRTRRQRTIAPAAISEPAAA